MCHLCRRPDGDHHPACKYYVSGEVDIDLMDPYGGPPAD